jgi:hypothetical protein
MLQVHFQQIPLHEVHLLEHSHCSVSKVGPSMPTPQPFFVPAHVIAW